MSLVAIRMSVFAGVFALLIVLERLFPRRATRRTGYLSNLGIFLIDSVLTRILVAISAAVAAAWAQSRGIGLFNMIDAPLWLSVIICAVLLDFAVWAQHVATHHIPVLWRLHEVHHSDPHVDATTGLRFHPVEIGLSLLFKSAIVVLLGAPVIAVIIFEVLLNAGAMFSHSNLKLPLRVDRVVRLFTVTPDMHRVHHSTDMGEANSNFGFFLSVWDRLFRTYTAQPSLGHDAMTLGVANAPTDQRLRKLLARPLDRRAPPRPVR